MKQALLLAFCVLVALPSVLCISREWVGENGDWNHPENWDPVGKPTTLDDCTVKGKEGKTIEITMASAAEANDVILQGIGEGQDSVTLVVGHTFNINSISLAQCMIIVESGGLIDLTIRSFQNTFTSTGSTVTVTNTGLFNISGGTAEHTSFQVTDEGRLGFTGSEAAVFEMTKSNMKLERGSLKSSLTSFNDLTLNATNSVLDLGAPQIGLASFQLMESSLTLSVPWFQTTSQTTIGDSTFLLSKSTLSAAAGANTLQITETRFVMTGSTFLAKGKTIVESNCIFDMVSSNLGFLDTATVEGTFYVDDTDVTIGTSSSLAGTVNMKGNDALLKFEFQASANMEYNTQSYPNTMYIMGSVVTLTNSPGNHRNSTVTMDENSILIYDYAGQAVPIEFGLLEMHQGSRVSDVSHTELLINNQLTAIVYSTNIQEYDDAPFTAQESISFQGGDLEVAFIVTDPWAKKDVRPLAEVKNAKGVIVDNFDKKTVLLGGLCSKWRLNKNVLEIFLKGCGLSNGGKAAIGIFVILLIAGAAVGGYFFYKRKARSYTEV